MRHQKQMIALAICAVLISGVAGTYNGLSARAASPHQTEELQVQVSPGYAIRMAADQFSAPVGLAAGDRGDVFVAEAGRLDGTVPRVLKLGRNNKHVVVADDFKAPLTGLTWYEGRLYVAYVGGVDMLDPATGNHHPILAKLPAGGDYPNGAVVFGPDGKLYFGIGSATNSGVVGLDNITRGWVAAAPDVRDIPCREIKLKGLNFNVNNPLTAKDPHDEAATGAFSPFGTTTARNQVIPGALPCNGAILRANPDGTSLEMVAWGMRYPAGLNFAPGGDLYFTMQGFEERGSRPIVGDRDYLYKAVPGEWYGWPDFAGNRSVTSEQFQKPGSPVSPLLAEVPGQPPLPITSFAHGSGASGLLFPPDSFGLSGDGLVAMTGNMVVRVNPKTGASAPFLKNVGRPVALATGPKGTVYLLDYGQTRPGTAGPEAVPGTGRLWRIDWTAHK
jgi:glucose/arabinose dehydrogenase